MSELEEPRQPIFIPPVNCLKALAERVEGRDPLDARFCRYSSLMSPLVMDGVEVKGICLEPCDHEAVFGIDENGKVRISDETFDT